MSLRWACLKDWDVICMLEYYFSCMDFGYGGCSTFITPNTKMVNLVILWPKMVVMDQRNMFPGEKTSWGPSWSPLRALFKQKTGKNGIISVCIKNINQLCLFEAQNDKLESVECPSGEENLWGPL